MAFIRIYVLRKWESGFHPWCTWRTSRNLNWVGGDLSSLGLIAFCKTLNLYLSKHVCVCWPICKTSFTFKFKDWLIDFSGLCFLVSLYLGSSAKSQPSSQHMDHCVELAFFAWIRFPCANLEKNFRNKLSQCETWLTYFHSWELYLRIACWPVPSNNCFLYFVLMLR